MMKNKTFTASIICAAKGLAYAIRTEKNYKYYCLILFLSIIANIASGVSVSGYLCQIITAAGVFSAECLNTGIEHIMDMQSREIRTEIRIIKDLAAAGVLCWGIAFFACEIIVIGKAIG